ncbi:putative photosystem II stability/assembly factor-like protein [Xenococcus sp. PCC 7305]|uniref:photosynthesis system II assembly factor Ycf48 n=1 Tax=Xenococcus sp. PCC 7305 TaxID=102125 RepID=UPI0002AC5FD5|nr:photosynthesis system II assembly factor Ycf48 [Xenococcus sp. PCC 7305]ELS02405.1 putative photosystem II stability/assembly factor-like protein [Xenococcus sp. PCC 7305]
MNLLRQKLKQIVVFVVVSLFCISCSQIPSTTTNPWKILTLPTEAIFADIAFTDDPNHGWLVGTKASLFETTDGGDSWSEKVIDFGTEKISFSGVSFSGDEGWIVGKPSILLHTNDAGANWSRIALSSKLPGSPDGIIALAANSAEMVTDLGAIYKTTDGGENWKALVEGAVGVARNIERSADGRYVAVSANGNFYSTWKPGQTEWTPHNRNSSRRLQNMGFSLDGDLWLLARGGVVQFSHTGEEGEWSEAIYPEFSASWGLLDIGYPTSDEVWVAGGSGELLYSPDGGETWQKDREVEDAPSNLYKVIFQSPEQGFVLGERGVLLKYEPSSAAA